LSQAHPKHPITKDNIMSITSQALKIGAILLLTSGVSQLVPKPAQAGCFSDDCSNKRAAEASRGRTERYGGSASQGEAAYKSRRWGSGAPQFYNPTYYRSGAAATTTNQARDCQILAQQYNLTPDQGAKNIVAQVYQQQCSR
jgi:hypothetical protein